MADYNVAGTLVQYWAHDPSGHPWKHATLDGQACLPAATASSFDLSVDGENSINQVAEDNLNNEVSNDFDSALNLRIGAEYLIKKFRLRAGYGRYGNPFDTDDSGRNVISLGAGYRGKSVYFDLAFSTNDSNEAYTPYDTFVDEQQLIISDIRNNNFLFTFGYRF